MMCSTIDKLKLALPWALLSTSLLLLGIGFHIHWKPPEFSEGYHYWVAVIIPWYFCYALSIGCFPSAVLVYREAFSLYGLVLEGGRYCSH